MSAESAMMNSSSRIFITHHFCPLCLQYLKIIVSYLLGCMVAVKESAGILVSFDAVIFFLILNTFKVISLFLIYNSLSNMCPFVLDFPL